MPEGIGCRIPATFGGQSSPDSGDLRGADAAGHRMPEGIGCRRSEEDKMPEGNGCRRA